MLKWWNISQRSLCRHQYISKLYFYSLFSIFSSVSSKMLFFTENLFLLWKDRRCEKSFSAAKRPEKNAFLMWKDQWEIPLKMLFCWENNSENCFSCEQTNEKDNKWKCLCDKTRTATLEKKLIDPGRLEWESSAKVFFHMGIFKLEGSFFLKDSFLTSCIKFTKKMNVLNLKSLTC